MAAHRPVGPESLNLKPENEVIGQVYGWRRRSASLIAGDFKESSIRAAVANEESHLLGASRACGGVGVARAVAIDAQVRAAAHEAHAQPGAGVWIGGSAGVIDVGIGEVDRHGSVIGRRRGLSAVRGVCGALLVCAYQLVAGGVCCGYTLLWLRATDGKF